MIYSTSNLGRRGLSRRATGEGLPTRADAMNLCADAMNLCVRALPVAAAVLYVCVVHVIGLVFCLCFAARLVILIDWLRPPPLPSPPRASPPLSFPSLRFPPLP